MWLAVGLRTSLLVIVAILIMGVCNQASAQKCLEYGPTVTLTGRLYSRVFPGPPNYESIRKGDKKETALLLKLVKKVCVAGKDVQNLEISETGVRDVQLVILNDKHWKTVRRVKGKRAIITGTLFHGNTGHHRTKILIQVSNIKSAKNA